MTLITKAEEALMLRQLGAGAKQIRRLIPYLRKNPYASTSTIRVACNIGNLSSLVSKNNPKLAKAGFEISTAPIPGEAREVAYALTGIGFGKAKTFYDAIKEEFSMTREEIDEILNSKEFKEKQAEKERQAEKDMREGWSTKKRSGRRPA